MNFNTDTNNYLLRYLSIFSNNKNENCLVKSVLEVYNFTEDEKNLSLYSIPFIKSINSLDFSKVIAVSMITDIVEQLEKLTSDQTTIFIPLLDYFQVAINRTNNTCELSFYCISTKELIIDSEFSYANFKAGNTETILAIIALLKAKKVNHDYNFVLNSIHFYIPQLIITEFINSYRDNPPNSHLITEDITLLANISKNLVTLIPHKNYENYFLVNNLVHTITEEKLIDDNIPKLN